MTTFCNDFYESYLSMLPAFKIPRNLVSYSSNEVQCLARILLNIQYAYLHKEIVNTVNVFKFIQFAS